MTLPGLPTLAQIRERLPEVFPPGTPNRDHAVWEIAAKTIFVMLYAGAVEGADKWLRPDQVTRMTDAQASRADAESRSKWAQASIASGKGDIPGRWYAVNTRESIRDDTIRYSLLQNGSVIEKPGLATTSPAGRYALQKDFAVLLDPLLDDSAFETLAAKWRKKFLNKGALARIAIMRKGAIAGDGHVVVTFPSGETRSMSPGPSTEIAKAVIETFAPKFLRKPAVIFLSESGAKVVARDDALAKAIGLKIASDRNLPDIVLADLGPAHPLLVFVEVVATDGPVNETRKRTLLAITKGAGFSSAHVAFLTAYMDRTLQPFRKTVADLAWGTYAWFAAEPENLVFFSDKARRLTAL